MHSFDAGLLGAIIIAGGVFRQAAHNANQSICFHQAGNSMQASASYFLFLIFLKKGIMPVYKAYCKETLDEVA